MTAETIQVIQIVATAVVGILAVVMGFLSATRHREVVKLDGEMKELQTRRLQCEERLEKVETEVRGLLVAIAMKEMGR